MDHSKWLFGFIAGFGLMWAAHAAGQNFTAWPVTQIAAGNQHSLFIRADGTLFVMGDNTSGQLGLGSAITNVNVPTPLTNGVGAIAAGYGHSLFIQGGELWAMGENNFGQLGDGTTNNRYLPEEIVSSGVTTISAGYRHSLFITRGGSPYHIVTLWGMGYNFDGELGDGSYNSTNRPEAIENSLSSTIGTIKAIAAGGAHSLFITTDGSLWGMGSYYYGQLGLGGSANNSDTTNLPEEILSSSNPNGPVTAVAAGNGHSLFLTSDQSLWVMGDNYFGQLGVYDQYSPLQEDYPMQVLNPYVISNFSNPPWYTTGIAAGVIHSLFIRPDGTLWSVGDNGTGQLGCGGHNFNTDNPQLIASNVVAVSGGGSHSLFVKSDGSLWGMGDNSHGQLGTGDYLERDTPVEIVAPPPRVSIVPYGGNVILAWPTNAAAFVLQSSSNLVSPNWTTVTPGPVILGDECEVIVAPSGAQRYYRLVLNP